jgi:hypothetical protein
MPNHQWWVTDTDERPLRKSRTKRAAMLFGLKESRRLDEVLELHYVELPAERLNLVGKIYPEGEFSHI